jgi:hypothetical protein
MRRSWASDRRLARYSSMTRASNAAREKAQPRDGSIAARFSGISTETVIGMNEAGNLMGRTPDAAGKGAGFGEKRLDINNVLS